MKAGASSVRDDRAICEELAGWIGQGASPGDRVNADWQAGRGCYSRGGGARKSCRSLTRFEIRRLAAVRKATNSTLAFINLVGSMVCRLVRDRPVGSQFVWASRYCFHVESMMSQTANPDHDQRLKVLLKEFFEGFFLCFFPAWAERFEFTEIDWLDKELFLAPPQGEKRQLDLVARLRLRPDAPPPRADVTDLVALVHVELESRAGAAAFRPRMFDYYIQLRRDTGLPVLPIALFLRVGLDGIGWDAYEEFFWEQRIVRFEYAYVGLPALDAEQYGTGENLLGVARAR